MSVGLESSAGTMPLEGDWRRGVADFLGDGPLLLRAAA